MDILSFHLMGKMAHFRKFYSNSTALSFYIPPRTTICGIIAGLLGLTRDSYYEEFSLNNCQIAVAIKSPIKKTMQKLNYLMIKSVNDLNGSQENHSQTGTELVIPQNIIDHFIDYQIWFHHKDPTIQKDLESCVINKDSSYKSRGISVALGSAFCLGWINNGEKLEGTVKSSNNLSEIVWVNSAIPLLDSVINIDFAAIQSKTTENNNQYRMIKEEVPLEFDKYRRITEKGLRYMVFNFSQEPIPVKVETYIQLENQSKILWME
jgi:CRISPR-associated protein Cas5h